MSLLTLVTNQAGTAANSTYGGVLTTRTNEYRRSALSIYAYASVWGSASVTIQVSPDGVNWVPTAITFTANGYAQLDITAVAVRAVVSSATLTTAGLNVVAL